MNVYVADACGFCYGVRRAVEMASSAASGTHTLGPIIHNPQVVARLAERGVSPVDSLDSLQRGDTILIRSHGVGPDVYREAEVQQCLEDPQVAVFLQQYGYESTQAEACLNHLGARVSLSAQGMEHYPHEMGIFLGYPLEDVRGFIRHEGKESRYTGYWKVYGDVTQAKQIFQAYDDAKECAVMEYMAGKHMHEIAC